MNMARLSASRIAVRTRPSFDCTMNRHKRSEPSSATPVATNSAARVEGAVTEKPRIRLKSVKPLLPPKPVSLRKNSSMNAYVSACVMIEKYTPLMRERNAKKPNTNARMPGTSTTSSAAYQKGSVKLQYQGEAFQSRNTMKSGRLLW